MEFPTDFHLICDRRLEQKLLIARYFDSGIFNSGHIPAGPMNLIADFADFLIPQCGYKFLLMQHNIRKDLILDRLSACHFNSSILELINFGVNSSFILVDLDLHVCRTGIVALSGDSHRVLTRIGLLDLGRREVRPQLEHLVLAIDRDFAVLTIKNAAGQRLLCAVIHRMRRLLREHTLGDRLRIDLPRHCLGTTHQIRRHCDRIRPGVGRFRRAANGAAARQIQRIVSLIRVRHADRRPLLHAVVCVRIPCQSHRQQAGIEFVHGVVELIYCRFIDAIVSTDVFRRLVRHRQRVGFRHRILLTTRSRDNRVAWETQLALIDEVRNVQALD